MLQERNMGTDNYKVPDRGTGIRINTWTNGRKCVILHDLGFCHCFLGMTPETQATKENKFDFIRIKNLYIKGHHQETGKTIHREHTCESNTARP